MTSKPHESWDTTAAEQSKAQALEEELAAGDRDAYWRLADLYETGRGVTRDLERAFQLRQEGAKLGDPNATVDLAYSYEFAVGTEENSDEAARLYKRALDLNAEFERREFALCQYTLSRIKANYDGIRLLASRLPSGQIELQIAVPENSAAADIPELFKQCSVYASVFFLAEISTLLYDRGEPKGLCEIVAGRYARRASLDWIILLTKGYMISMWRFYQLYDCEGVRIENSRNPELLRRLRDFNMSDNSEIATRFVAQDLEEREDVEGASEWRSKSSNRDDVDSLCNSGLYERDCGNLEAAVRYFRLGAKEKHAPSLHFLGEILWESPKKEDKEEAVQCWKKSAAGGFGAAQERYAQYLASLDEEDPSADYTEIASLYKRASEKGFATSTVAYGALLYRGQGVAKNVALANKYFKKAEESGFSPALFALAQLKFNGEGDLRDPIDALRLLTIAAQDFAVAQFDLGMRLLRGVDAPINFQRGAYFLARAASEGFSLALFELAFCCFEGVGVPKNELAGIFLLGRAAEEGNANAAFELGELYAHGRVVPKNMSLAARWYEQGADDGSAVALSRLAACVNAGEGVRRDPVMAVALWERAVALGDEEAAEEIVRARLALAVEEAFNMPGLRELHKLNATAASHMELWFNERRQELGSAPTRESFMNEYERLFDLLEFKFFLNGLRKTVLAEFRPSPVQDLLQLLLSCSDSNFLKKGTAIDK